MKSTVINVFESGVVEKVIAELEKEGFARKDINVLGKGTNAKSLTGNLTSESVPDEETKRYIEAVSAGKTLIYVKADDAQAQRVVAIMERYSGGQSAPTEKGAAKGRAAETSQNEGEVALPVIEEQLQVGKREVERGGVRIYSRVTESPVEETVTLREETVHVERRPVNREVSQADMATLREGEFDVRTTGEEAVVAKQARVVEEVVVTKDVTERDQTVRDTVRRTDVDVEQINTETTKARGKSNRS
ncbi:MAG TPA: YsnF/AvaK domain-containing protein [Pyrinomonadaceae bacterium]|nr:YsnF/AvaK domain-containing protein [Pyrinomonadaceae bacterium]